MSAEMVFRVSGLIGTIIVMLSLLNSFPAKNSDLTGWQAIGFVGIIISIMAQIFSFGTTK